MPRPGQLHTGRRPSPRYAAHCTACDRKCLAPDDPKKFNMTSFPCGAKLGLFKKCDGIIVLDANAS